MLLFDQHMKSPENSTVTDEIHELLRKAFAKFLAVRCDDPLAFVSQSQRNYIGAFLPQIVNMFIQMKIELPDYLNARSNLAFVCQNLVCDDRLRSK